MPAPVTTGFQRLKAFAKSPHHLWLAALTLGLGIASATGFGAIAGGALYLLGWIYLPDTPVFRRWMARRQEDAASDPAAEARADALFASRQRIFAALAPERQARYRSLEETATDIESHLAALPTPGGVLGIDLQMQPVDSLMASYLRLLHTEQILESFIRKERDDNVAGAIADLRSELADLERGSGSRQLVESRQSKLETLTKRQARLDDAAAKLRLTTAEQERTAELIKLARADLVTSEDPAALRHRIDTGARQITAQTTWTDEWDAGDLDPTFDLTPGARVGFHLESPSSPPPIPVAE
ncbi:hypothetical protein BH23VER1_BH23VER1_17050 [soil metagenome]